MLSRQTRCEILTAAEQLEARETGKPTSPGYADARETLRRLFIAYGEMVAVCSSHAKPDRSAILRMAGNIAGGMMANPALANIEIRASDEQVLRGVASYAVALARAIMVETDKPEDNTK